MVGRKMSAIGEMYQKGTRAINKTFCRLRLIVLIAVTTGMRVAEIFGLKWSDVMYGEGLLAVRAKLKAARCVTSRCFPNWPTSCGAIPL